MLEKNIWQDLVLDIKYGWEKASAYLKPFGEDIIQRLKPFWTSIKRGLNPVADEEAESKFKFSAIPTMILIGASLYLVGMIVEIIDADLHNPTYVGLSFKVSLLWLTLLAGTTAGLTYWAVKHSQLADECADPSPLYSQRSVAALVKELWQQSCYRWLSLPLAAWVISASNFMSDMCCFQFFVGGAILYIGLRRLSKTIYEADLEARRQKQLTSTGIILLGGFLVSSIWGQDEVHTVFGWIVHGITWVTPDSVDDALLNSHTKHVVWSMLFMSLWQSEQAKYKGWLNYVGRVNNFLLALGTLTGGLGFGIAVSMVNEAWRLFCRNKFIEIRDREEATHAPE